METSLKNVNILWTGGWDSSFRVLELSRKNVTISPFYLIDDYRKSTEYEINTIRKISNAIREDSKTKAELKDISIHKITDIPKDETLKQALQALLKKQFLGGQYEWLAKFAETHQGLELCVHEDDKAFQIIKEYGSLIHIDDNASGPYKIVDSAKSLKEVSDLFGNFQFPLLNKSKLDMLKESKEQGFYDKMLMTWFCHTPKNGKPCGICNPCRYTIEEGLRFRFTKKALFDYEIRRWLGPFKETALFKMANKIRKKA